MKKRIIQFSILIVSVLLLRACLRSSFPEYIPDARQYSGAEWRKNYDYLSPPRFGLQRVRKGNLYGYVDKNGKEVIPVEYPYLGYFRNNYTDVYAQKEGGWGMVSFVGDYTPLFKKIESYPDFWKEQYSEIGYYSNGLAKVRSRDNAMYGFVDRNGLERIYCAYNAVGNFRDGMAWVSKWAPQKSGDVYGYINEFGEEILPCEYPNVSLFNEGLAWFAERKSPSEPDLFGFLNKQGEIVIPAEYQSVNSFKNGLAWAKKDDKVGFIDNKNRGAIPLEYDATGYFFNGMVWLKKADKYGLADASGKILLGCEYDEMGSFFSDFCRAKKGNAVVLLDKKGRIGYTADDIDAISEGKVAIKKGNKWGFIKIPRETSANYYHPAEILVEPSYDAVFPYFRDYAIVSNNKKYGLINDLGKVVVPLEYEAIGLWCEDYLRVRKGGKWGFLDLKDANRLIIPFQYQQAWNFKKDIALVKKDDLYTYVQYWGSEVSAFRENIGAYAGEQTAYKSDSLWHLKIKDEVNTFKYASSIIDGFAFIDYTHVIHSNGDIAFKLDFQNHHDFSEGLAGIKINKLWGFVNSFGDVQIDCTYDAVFDFSEGLAAVKSKDKWGFVDKKGHLVVPTIFDEVTSFRKGSAQVKLGIYRYELKASAI